MVEVMIGSKGSMWLVSCEIHTQIQYIWMFTVVVFGRDEYLVYWELQTVVIPGEAGSVEGSKGSADELAICLWRSVSGITKVLIEEQIEGF